jgi:DNA-binding MarR family transcriptional regulator
MSEKNDISDRKVGYLLKLVNDRLRTKADANLLEHDLTLSQSRILRFLSHHEGTATQKEIEDHLGVSHPTVVGLIARLKEKGFVECSTDKKDRRNRIITITAKAISLEEEMGKLIDSNEQKMLSALSDQQIMVLKSALETIFENLGD